VTDNCVVPVNWPAIAAVAVLLSLSFLGYGIGSVALRVSDGVRRKRGVRRGR
jgi:hypothetical protein